MIQDFGKRWPQVTTGALLLAMFFIVMLFGNFALFGTRTKPEVTFVSTAIQVQPDRLCDSLKMNTDRGSAFAFSQVCGR